MGGATILSRLTRLFRYSHNLQVDRDREAAAPSPATPPRNHAGTARSTRASRIGRLISAANSASPASAYHIQV